MNQAFTLSGEFPTKIIIRRTNDQSCKTARYAVIADYGWAESIICDGCYLKHAEAIGSLIAGDCGIDHVAIELELVRRDNPTRH